MLNQMGRRNFTGGSGLMSLHINVPNLHVSTLIGKAQAEAEILNQNSKITLRRGTNKQKTDAQIVFKLDHMVNSSAVNFNV